jgi:hypothetical protein
VPAAGEVIDRGAVEAAEIAARDIGADLIIIATSRQDVAAIELVEDARARAAGVPVEHLIVDVEAPAAPSGSGS